jgi:monoamine oxidase
MSEEPTVPMTRRSLFAGIGKLAGMAAMYQAMESLAFAAESTFKGPIQLSGAPKGKKILILGAGWAGMVAAFELRKAGYQVKILEFQNRAGGRNWSLYGGDKYTELGGFSQDVQFDKGLYLNPGPWRIPHHHQGVLHYAKMLNVALEPFIQINYNAYIHSQKAFGGKPQRYRAIQADSEGYIAELLAKTTRQGALDQTVTKEDKEMLLASLRNFGALDKDYRYVSSEQVSNRRGYDKPPSGGLTSRPVQSQPVKYEDLLHSGLWAGLAAAKNFDTQQTMFQPIGGMGMIGRAFGEALKDVIQYNSKVTRIDQSSRGVVVTYEDTVSGGAPRQEKADYLVCTIPASILSQIPLQVSAKMQAAINSLPYMASCKVGLQMKRRFWEEDEQIYGGITYTDMPNSMISYPSTGFFNSGKGVLLGTYAFGPQASIFTAMTPKERIAKTLEYGAVIHPQYKTEFETGATVAWHRVPWTLGCAGQWSEEGRDAHFDDLCAIDGRIVLAGEHASYIPAWQEGAVLSSLDAIERLHKKIIAA